MYKLLFFSIFILIFSSGCKFDPEKEFNNGNTNPAKLKIGINGLNVRTAVESHFGAGCRINIPFTAEIDLEVRTATWANGTVTVDPTPFDEGEFENVSLGKGFDGNQLQEIEVKVPSSGAYQIRLEIKLDNCSKCCQGTSANQCGSTQGVLQCGKPKVIFEKNFMADTRPPFNQTLTMSTNDWTVRKCAGCGCTGCN